MKKALTIGLLCLMAAAGAVAAPPSAALDSVYQFYAAKDLDKAYAILQRLNTEASTPADRFAVRLEIGDFLLDKKADYTGAESVYAALAAEYPKHKLLPDVLYRLALALEMQEDYLEGAKNYEIVATKYAKSTYGTDALDAIERCFRKNYQDRVAYVDSYPITRIEIDDRIGRNPSAYERYEKKQQLLDTMIDNRLLYSAALVAGTDTDSAFRYNLGEQRNRAMFQEWYAHTVTAKSQPTERELKAAYRKERDTKYTTPEKVHLYQIQVATRPEAEKLRQELLTDTTNKWDSLAKQFSTAPDREKGGDLGLVARGSQPKPIEDAAFRLKVGGISRPIPVNDAFVIVKVTEKKPKTVRTFADVRNQLSGEMQQENAGKLYEKAVADLKAKASIEWDTMAIEEGKDTLAVVNGIVIDTTTLMARLNAIPPFYRSQFDTPEGKHRILENLVLENLLLKETEAGKLWLVNKVVDQLLSRRTGMLLDAYKRRMINDKVVLDSAQMMADYKATISEYKEPTKVHAREITAPSRSRAQELRNWARSGRLPVMIQGRGLLLPEGEPDIEAAFSSTTANTDSLLGEHALAGAPVVLPGKPMVSVGSKNVPDIAQKTDLTGPYVNPAPYGLAFSDISRQDRLYEPVPVKVERQSQLDSLLGKPARPDSMTAAPTDSAKLGVYVTMEEVLPTEFVAGLFKLDEKETAKPLTTESGTLLIKVTKKDTAQKATFSDIAKRFSKSSSRWSGGDLYWLARDDKAHDKKLIDAVFNLSKGDISPVIRLNDSTYVFATVEERKAAFTRPFSEVRSKIENKLRRAEEKKLYDQLLDDLRAEADIQILMKESDFAVERPPIEIAPTEAQPETPAPPDQK
ncbi:peptidyl-prolyl cis-trans isomerase [candidate division WOR-3 bacterium]|nr:peptidyl-prolyl cis-trans isomerase [candidate division WOR-3 bacterium]